LYLQIEEERGVFESCRTYLLVEINDITFVRTQRQLEKPLSGPHSTFWELPLCSAFTNCRERLLKKLKFKGICLFFSFLVYLNFELPSFVSWTSTVHYPMSRHMSRFTVYYMGGGTQSGEESYQRQIYSVSGETEKFLFLST
jgi:hypothetical protein